MNKKILEYIKGHPEGVVAKEMYPKLGGETNVRRTLRILVQKKLVKTKTVYNKVELPWFNDQTKIKLTPIQQYFINNE